jgi:hypothetical protein
MATVKVDLPIFTGLTLTLWVYQDGVLINTGGDSLTEIGNGHFQATVAESLSGTYTAQIQNTSSQVIAYGDFDSTGLYVGRLTDVTGGDATAANQITIISDIADIDTDVQEMLTNQSTIINNIGGGLPASSRSAIRASGTTLSAFVGEEITFTIFPLDALGNEIDPTLFTLRVVIEEQDKTDVQVIEDVDLTKTSISYSFTVTSATTATARTLRWSARQTASNLVFSQGTLNIVYAAILD